jgi:hypothetical protein
LYQIFSHSTWYKKHRSGQYGHDIEESFDIPAKTAELEAIRALETFDQLSGLIQERHDRLLSSAADAAKQFVTNELLGEGDEELHRLSMHFSVGDYHLDSLLILSLSPDRILYQGRGRVYVRMQYEWDSAVAWDDVAIVLDVYPFECSFEANTSDPLLLLSSVGR